MQKQSCLSKVAHTKQPGSQKPAFAAGFTPTQQITGAMMTAGKKLKGAYLMQDSKLGFALGRAS